MKLISFGRVHLEGSGFSRPKPLLLLAYVCLEGPQERRKLADLFWLDDAKALGYLSVVLAQFKREGAVGVFPDGSGINPLPSLVECDALEFLEKLEQKQLEQAIGLYSGAFLQDLGKPLESLEVSTAILDWVLEKQEWFAQQAQSAMLALAEQQLAEGALKPAKALIERAYNLQRTPELEPALLARFQQVTLQTGSALSDNLEGTIQANLDELPDQARKVFIALSLQPKPNLTIVRSALGLSLGQLSEARETLIMAGLIDPQSTVLAAEMTRHWLEEHPIERMPLLMALARSTPPEEAFTLFQQIYQSTQGFGGIGDLNRARSAYATKAQTLLDTLQFAEATRLLGQLRAAERVAEADPDPQTRFLEAYALERLGRFKEALELLQGFSPEGQNPNWFALKSVLLWRTGNSQEAQTAAEQAIKSGLEWLWARATANNTLGYLAVSQEHFLKAASHFRKAASLYLSAGEKNRYVGSLNNHAIALDRVSEAAEREGRDNQALEQLQVSAEQAYQQTLEALEQNNENPALKARILLNLGMLWERRKHWSQAEQYYLQASPFAEAAKALDVMARLQLNLGVIYDQQQRTTLSRSSYAKAIEVAAQAGEFLIQGQAVGNMAILDSDPDAMEVALDLIEQTGNTNTVVLYLQFYESILKRSLEQALSSNNASQAFQLLTRLNGLYERLEDAPKTDQVQSALQALLHLQDVRPHKELLMSLIMGNKDPSLPSSPSS